MDRIAYYSGYLRKTAWTNPSPSPFSELVQKFALRPAITVVGPAAGAYGLGRMTGSVMEPSQEELNQLQAQYVKVKLEQAIKDLEKRREHERMKQEHGRHTSTLRI